MSRKYWLLLSLAPVAAVVSVACSSISTHARRGVPAQLAGAQARVRLAPGARARAGAAPEVRVWDLPVSKKVAAQKAVALGEDGDAGEGGRRRRGRGARSLSSLV